MTRDEYEQKLDELKGQVRDLIEYLINTLDDPDEAFKKASADYCYEVALLLNMVRHDIEVLQEDFENPDYEDEETRKLTRG